MEKKYCPICLKEYEIFPSKCTCGYDAFDKKDLLEDAQLFKIFKFAKQVYLGLISYDKSELRINESDDYLYIEDIKNSKRGLEYIDYANKNKPTSADEGLFAMRYSTVAVILNCDYINFFVFDDSNVRILILGEDVKGFSNGTFMQYCNLRYIYVDDKNPYFETRDNVLIDKRSMTLIVYPNDKKDEEYKVDKDIKRICESAFKFQTHLKRIYIPKSIILSTKKNKIYNVEVIRY